MRKKKNKGSLVVVSNRLPIILSKKNDDEWDIHPGSGGLVTALGPALHDRQGTWIGWLGTHEKLPDRDGYLEDLLKRGSSLAGYTLKPVELNEEDVDKYYKGFSNEILWPLFHDFPSLCNFNPDYWEAYIQANQKFTQGILNYTSEDDYLWIQDYHLMLVAEQVRQHRPKQSIGFFLHIPFPPADLFIKMPWRHEILEALLEYDLLGFQTMRDKRNFLQCVKAMYRNVSTRGRGHVSLLKAKNREVRVGAFPISIDYKEFEDQAHHNEVSERSWIIRANMPNSKLMLGVDRLDYSKGIPNRILAFARALEKYPEIRGKITLVQVVVPSRRQMTHYEYLKRDIERLVGEINGQYTEVAWVPVQYVFRSLDRTELVSYYRTSEIALITPLKDGMNLVAKEYCAASIEEDGVLILSEFAGAAVQMQAGAILVNPFDIDSVADAIYQAYSMSYEERKRRMRKLRLGIRKNSIFHWVTSFLEAGMGRSMKSYPTAEHFLPPSSKTTTGK